MIVTFRVQYDTVWGESLGVFVEGNASPTVLSTVDGHWWEGTAEFHLPYTPGQQVGYRYAVWREGRITRCECGRRPHVLTWTESREPYAFLDAWTDIKGEEGERIAGTAVPLFSLRSQDSQGVGDFGDLRRMVDWCVHTGQRALQLLPINDTTKSYGATDSYPYSSISIFALHPMYMDLHQLTPVKKARGRKILEELSLLNQQSTVDYPAVNRLKHEYLHLLYEQTGAQTLGTSSYQEFLQTNEDWLMPYAAFCYLRDKYHTAAFRTWRSHSEYDAEKIQKLIESHRESVSYYSWVQFLLHLQLSDVARYARRHGVMIKGDIPIGIDPDSVEAWQTPHLFNMNGSAGAPPDAFSADGQNWGFPTYNWSVMATDAYAWWRRRFQKMAEYFQAYRIDHILGFFRIWEIPTHSVRGILGQFSPAMPMTADEIASWGLAFQEDMMTRPCVNETYLQLHFGAYADVARKTFFQRVGGDLWTLSPDFQTQRQIAAWFEKKHRGIPAHLREALYDVTENVLFVRDREGRGWHPRINAYTTDIYTHLSDEARQAFDRIHGHYYFERHNHFWYEQAMLKLPALMCSTPLMPCGEDLGMVPACVPWVMNVLQINSLEIERMPKAPGLLFGDVAHYPQRSVCTIGTHDMSTLRGWWHEDCELSQRYYNEVLGHEGEAPHEITAELCAEVVGRHLQSPSALCILALQDWLSLSASVRIPEGSIDSERINIPAVAGHYWNYRMHLTLEELMQSHALNTMIRTQIADSHRCGK